MRFLTLLLNSNEKIQLLVFSLHVLFRRDQNQYSKLTSKTMEMCEQFLKKARQYISQSLNCKKTEHQYNPILGWQKIKKKSIIAPAIAIWLIKSKNFAPTCEG